MLAEMISSEHHDHNKSMNTMIIVIIILQVHDYTTNTMDLVFLTVYVLSITVLLATISCLNSNLDLVYSHTDKPEYTK